MAVLLGVAAAVLVLLSANRELGGSASGSGLRPDFLVTVVALTILAIGTYLIWPSRWNIPAHLQVGFAITAYVIPGYFIPIADRYSEPVIDSLAWILALGTLCYLAGLVIGSLAARRLRARLPAKLRPGSAQRLRAFVPRRVAVVTALAVSGMALSFAVMGFVPLLAEDPLAAKYFRGPYREPYERVASLFVPTLGIASTLIPVALAVWYVTRRRLHLALALAALVAMAGTLQRATFSIGVLSFLGLLAAYRRKWFPAYIVLVVLVVPFGAALFQVAGVLGSGSFAELSAPDTGGVVGAIVAGAPDLNDTARFVENFIAAGELNYGRTFYGGLVPGRYEWNPAVWSVSIAEPGANPAEVPSGGLRLPVPVWGYASFGWIGVAALPLASGLVLGAITHMVRSLVGRRSLLESTLVLLLYTTLGFQLANFHLLSIRNLPGIAVALLLLWGIGGRRNDG